MYVRVHERTAILRDRLRNPCVFGELVIKQLRSRPSDPEWEPPHLLKTVNSLHHRMASHSNGRPTVVTETVFLHIRRPLPAREIMRLRLATNEAH